MRPQLRLLFAGILTLAPGLAIADPAAEARAAGLAAGATIQADLAEAPVIEMTPGYTATPPEASLGASELGGAATAKRSACADERSVECEAINTGQADAEIRAYLPSMVDDPEVRAAIAVTDMPLLDGVAAGYSDCSTDTVDRGIVTSDIQSCNNYYLRALDQECKKVRKVNVTWHCPASMSGPLDDGVKYYCERVETREVATCLETEASVGGYCVDYWTDEMRPPDIEVITEVIRADATPHVEEWWDNPCADYESRVPPGLLPPDGVETLPGMGGPTGRLDKCERATSECSDSFPAVRTINRLPVGRTCWAFTNTFNCVNRDPRSDCHQPRFGECTALGALTCVDYDAFDPRFCTAETQNFSCTNRDTRRTESVLNCGAQTYTDREGMTWDTGHEPDTDFLAVIAYMEAGREAGKYMTDATQVFRGFDNRCRKKLFGLVNCCNRGGSPAGSMFNNLSIAMGTGAAIGKAAVSSYAFDALFASNAPDFLISGFSSLFGTGTSSALAGMLAGDITVKSFMSTLVPSYWTIAILAIQMSGILECEDAEHELALKRDAELCVSKGNYCSRRLPIIKTCIERTYTYCCFNSRLAKLVHQQGRGQLGLPMGDARTPHCQGFTPEELQRLDLSRMDLSEFIDEINAAAVEMTATIGRANPMECYYGGGKC